MALSTRTELIASIQAWLAETSTEVDLASRAPDFITLLEEELNNDEEFRLLDMQKVQTFTVAAVGSRFVLPDNYLEMDYLKVSSDTRDPLQFVSPRSLRAKISDPGYVCYYSIINQELWTYPDMPVGGVLEMGFYRSLPALTASNETNWLLTKSPGMYLYGSLRHAEPYLENDARAATWDTLFEKRRQGLIDANEKAVTSAGPLTVEIQEQVA